MDQYGELFTYMVNLVPNSTCLLYSVQCFPKCVDNLLVGRPINLNVCTCSYQYINKVA